MLGRKMKQVAEYRGYADICRKLSVDMRDAVTERQLLEMAAVWTMLAIEREIQSRGVSRTCPRELPGTDEGAAWP